MDTLTRYLTLGLGAAVLLLIIYCLMLRNDRDQALNKLEVANNTIINLNVYIEKTNQQLKAIQQLDADYQETLRHVQTESDKLRDSLANNIKRVYVKAKCPASTDTATASRIDATAVRLADDARQDYLRLRLGIEQTRQQVLGLQNYIKTVCLSY